MTDTRNNLDLKYEKQNYKKAWENYQTWYKTNGIMLSARTLFDFFDLNEVYIEISTDYDFKTKKVDNKWSYTITEHLNSIRLYGTPCESRKSSEIAAFKIAFKILEDKILMIERMSRKTRDLKNKKPGFSYRHPS